MAPEYLNGQPADARADVYSLGVLLYEMLTGRRPLGGNTLVEQDWQRNNAGPPPPQQWNPAVPASLGDIVMTALAPNPAERFASASAFARALRGYAETSTQR
jgi:serine/threonine-protein kinase